MFNSQQLIECRFTDFQVNEIGKDGKVVHLRSIGLTEEERQQVRNPKVYLSCEY